MPEYSDSLKNSRSLSVRIEALRLEVQELVGKGVEHPLFEFKRELSIARENLDDRLDFIKLLQGVANSGGQEEHCIIVGGDPAKKMFYDVENCSEFDHANVVSILSKYLDPVPRLQIFNSLLTKDGKRFVLFVLDADQPRPIVLKTEGARADGKARLRVGEIWIKRGTGLFVATRADIDAMYRSRMEEEAEDRARKRLKHLAEISALGGSAGKVSSQAPSPELFLRPGAEFRRFIEEVIAEKDLSRLGMLVELAREWLVEGWDQIGARRNLQAQRLDQLAGLNLILVEEFFRDKFIPSLQSLTALGLLIIKYNQQPSWLYTVAEILSDAFESARGLQSLKNFDASREHAVAWWRPGLEIYIAAKCVASYCVHRKRHEFLPALLRRTAMRIESDDRETQKTPLLFWPLSVYTEFFPNGQAVEGRATFFWQQRVGASWGSYFGSFENFISSSCQLEFILELNSYLGTNMLDDKEIAKWLSGQSAPIWYSYNPDLFSYSLNQTSPMAEMVLEWVKSDSKMQEISVNPGLMAAALKSRDLMSRHLLVGGFCDHLHSWQSRYAMQHGKFPPFFEWPSRLKEAVQQNRIESKRQSQS